MASIPFHQKITCTIPEAVDASGLGRTKLYELIDDGRVESLKVDNRRLIRVASLLKLLGVAAEQAAA